MKVSCTSSSGYPIGVFYVEVKILDFSDGKKKINYRTRFGSLYGLFVVVLQDPLPDSNVMLDWSKRLGTGHQRIGGL